MRNQWDERLEDVLKIWKGKLLRVLSLFFRGYGILFGIFSIMSNLCPLNNLVFGKMWRSFGAGKGHMISLGNNILGSKMRYHYNMMRLIFLKWLVTWSGWHFQEEITESVLREGRVIEITVWQLQMQDKYSFECLRVGLNALSSLLPRVWGKTQASFLGWENLNFTGDQLKDMPTGIKWDNYIDS